MTKEEKKTFAALKKNANKIIKPLLKPYSFKMIGSLIWTVREELLFVLYPSLAVPIGSDKAFLKVQYGAKPLFVDDCLWDVLGLEENKKAPLSLRVNGAFTVQSVRFYTQKYPLELLAEEELSNFMKGELEDFLKLISSAATEGLPWFYKMEAGQSSYWQSDVMRLMLLIHDKKYDEVLEYVRKHPVSDFVVGGKKLWELAAEYCL